MTLFFWNSKLSVFLLNKFYSNLFFFQYHLTLYVTVDGQWANWGSWRTCSVTCGGGSQSRSRTCTNPAPQYNGSPCPNSDTSTQACNTHHCPSKCDIYLINLLLKTFSNLILIIFFLLIPWHFWVVNNGLSFEWFRNIRNSLKNIGYVSLW